MHFARAKFWSSVTSKHEQTRADVGSRVTHLDPSDTNFDIQHTAMSRQSNVHSLFSSPAFSALEVEPGEDTEEEELPEEFEEKFVQHITFYDRLHNS